MKKNELVGGQSRNNKNESGNQKQEFEEKSKGKGSSRFSLFFRNNTFSGDSKRPSTPNPSSSSSSSSSSSPSFLSSVKKSASNFDLSFFSNNNNNNNIINNNNNNHNNNDFSPTRSPKLTIGSRRNSDYINNNINNNNNSNNNINYKYKLLDEIQSIISNHSSKSDKEKLKDIQKIFIDEISSNAKFRNLVIKQIEKINLEQEYIDMRGKSPSNSHSRPTRVNSSDKNVFQKILSLKIPNPMSPRSNQSPRSRSRPLSEIFSTSNSIHDFKKHSQSENEDKNEQITQENYKRTLKENQNLRKEKKEINNKMLQMNSAMKKFQESYLQLMQDYEVLVDQRASIQSLMNELQNKDDKDLKNGAQLKDVLEKKLKVIISVPISNGIPVSSRIEFFEMLNSE